MEQNMAMFNSRYDQFDYSKDRGATAPKIAVDSAMEKVYEEATTDDISALYTQRRLNEAMIRLFEESKWKEKYGIDINAHNRMVEEKEREEQDERERTATIDQLDTDIIDDDQTLGFYEDEDKPKKKPSRKEKKVEKSDMSELFYYFHDKLAEEIEAGETEIFCTIVEFFGMNYKTVFDDVLTIKHKIKILSALEEKYGIKKELGTRKGRLY